MVGSAGEQFTRERRRWSLKRKFKQDLSSLIDKKDYPNCPGTFSDCPEKIEDPKDPPKQCKTCPKYVNSEFYTPPKRELPDFLRKMYEEGKG